MKAGTKLLTMRVTEELLQQAKALAAREGKSLAEWLRDLICREIGRALLTGQTASPADSENQEARK